MKNQSNIIIYPSHYRYKIQFIIGIFLTVAFGWSYLDIEAADTAFFTCACLSITLWSLRDMLSYIELASDSMRLKRHLGTSSRPIALRQINSVSEEGRIGNSITLLYHPRQNDGLLDLDSIESLILPQLQRQDELYKKLTAGIPT